MSYITWAVVGVLLVCTHTCDSQVWCAHPDCPFYSRCWEYTTGLQYCLCHQGFRVNATGQCIDIDECSWDVCKSRGRCSNYPGGYQCDDECDRGLARTCTDVDECEFPVCGPNGNCVKSVLGSYRCGCPPGYQFINGSCLDIDECNWNPCGSFGCNNFAGGYDCQYDGCFPGLTKQYQSVCADIDECELDICGPNSNCTNVWRSYLCQCLPGYQVRNGSCSDVDECTVPRPCHPNADCTNLPGTYNCTCKDGFFGNGTHCEDVNECMVHHPCHPNADCINLPGTYNCTCKDGFFGNRTHCEVALPSSAPAHSSSVAVGVAFGCIFLVLVVLLVLFMIRRRQRQKATTPSTPNNHTTSGQPEDPNLYSNNLVKERKILMKQLKQSEQENLPDASGGVYENQPTIIQDGGSSYDTLWKSVGSGQPLPDNAHAGNDDTYNHLHSQAVRSSANTEGTTAANLYNHLYSRTSA